MMKPVSASLLGECLVEQGMISRGQLTEALEQQKNTPKRLGDILLQQGWIQDRGAFFSLLARHIGTTFADLSEREIAPECTAFFPAPFAAHYRVMPLIVENDLMVLAAADPLDQGVRDGIHLVWPGRIRLLLAPEQEILKAVYQYYGVGAETIDAMMGDRPAAGLPVAFVDDIAELHSEASVGKFLNQILFEAYQKRATDIHIEPFESAVTIRYRIDGVLSDVQVPENIRHFRDAISSRIKIMARLNIAERRLPQDGRFRVRVKDMDLDLRVSVLPTPNGESLVVRLLTAGKNFDLAGLGFSQDQRCLVDELTRRPHGMIFVTGPTGSGKTTTLYCFLSQVSGQDKKIVTIEDPVEYMMNGVTQLQVNPAIHFTFASGLRSILRHDPDIMMVGEVRDGETAGIAVQAALTGHLVFSTLHTNDAAGAVARLLDMGIEPYLISSATEAVIAQRLVRRICPHCKKAVLMSGARLRECGFPAEADVDVYEGEGCSACDFSGYYGREGIFEFLLMTDPIREEITARASASRIRETALHMGMRPLRQDGWDKILRGVTTVSEVVRVTTDKG